MICPVKPIVFNQINIKGTSPSDVVRTEPPAAQAKRAANFSFREYSVIFEQFLLCTPVSKFLSKRSESPLKMQYNESDEQSGLQRDDSHENIIHEEWHDWQALGTHFSYIFRRSTTNAKTPVRFDVIGAGPEWISVGEILL